MMSCFPLFFWEEHSLFEGYLWIWQVYSCSTHEHCILLWSWGIIESIACIYSPLFAHLIGFGLSKCELNIYFLHKCNSDMSSQCLRWEECTGWSWLILGPQTHKVFHFFSPLLPWTVNITNDFMHIFIYIKYCWLCTLSSLAQLFG